MRRIGYFILPWICVFQFYSTPSNGDHQYVKQRCEKFRYEITVPARWETDEVTLEKKHIFVSYTSQAEIRVRAFLTEGNDIESTVHKRQWNLRSIDPLLNTIIETEKIHIRKNIRDRLLVFEYRSNKTKILQRTMISRSGNIIYIVDCKAPLNYFYKNEEFFNIAMSSFSISGDVQDNESRSENSIHHSNKKTALPANDTKKHEEEDTF